MYFEVYTANDASNQGAFRWRLVVDMPGGKRNIIADSGEGYHNYSDVKQAINNIKENAKQADIIFLTAKKVNDANS